MAQSIMGLDIGARTVKALVIEGSLRRFEATRFEEVGFPPPSEPADQQEDGGVEQGSRDDEWFHRLGKALDALKARLGGFQPELCVAALPGERVTVRPITLPFTRAREIEMVLGQEVEDYIPFKGIDDVVYDYTILAREEDSTTLMVAVCDKGFLARFLGVMAEHGFDPRVVGAAGLSKATLMKVLFPQQSGPVAVVDMGYERTTISVVSDGRPMLWRCIQRGARQVVERLLDEYDVDRQGAHRYLETGVRIIPSHSVEGSRADVASVSDLVKDALKPLVRAVRQTMYAYTGVYEDEIREVYLCGGFSLVPGLPQHLAATLGKPMRELGLGDQDWLRFGVDQATAARMAEVTSLALAGLPQLRHEGVNFRKGQFAFQGGYQFVRGKILALAAVLSVLILALGFYTYAKAMDLAEQERHLIADLKARTQALFGEPMADAEAAMARLRRTKKGAKRKEIPEQSAYDLFHDISRAIPYDVQVDLEQLTIDLDRHRAELRGKTTSATAVERIVEALDKLPCFKGGIEKEKNEKVGAGDKQLFVLSIRMGC